MLAYVLCWVTFKVYCGLDVFNPYCNPMGSNVTDIHFVYKETGAERSSHLCKVAQVPLDKRQWYNSGYLEQVDLRGQVVGSFK